MRVDLDELAFSGADTHPMARWKCTSLTGWDSPDVRRTLDEATGRDGARMPAGYHGPRKMILVGKAYAKAGYDASDLANELSRLTNLVRSTGLLVVHEAAQAKQCRVGRADSPIIERPTNSRIEFSIPLLAPDPVKYSTVERETVITVTAGNQSATGLLPNDGETDVEPHEITIAGSGVPPITLTQVGRAKLIRLSRGLSGNRYVIDPQDRQVRYGPSGDEKNAYRFAAGSSWWTIAPGGITIRARRRSTSGTTTVTVRHRDGWL